MSNITFKFDGKVVLITGSSSGIGASTAILFSKAHAQVVITGRNVTKLADVAQKCQQISPNGLKPLVVSGDVTKEEDLRRLVTTSIVEFGKIDILVNNAGCYRATPISDHDYLNSFNRVMDLNLKSVVTLTHLCVEYLAKSKGCVINISSIGGLLASKEASVNCMSKSAMDMFTKCMAIELGRKGIRVNSVNPGFVKDTDVMVNGNYGLDRTQSNAIFESFAKKIPVERAVVPDEIGNTILYLSSIEASFITGTILVADGGQLASGLNFTSE